MAFNYYTIDSIKEIDASNIPERFIKYFQNLSEEMKKEIFDVRPDLAEAIGRTDAGNGDETVKKETIDNSTDIIAERKAEELTERDLSEEELQIIDKWEDISIRSWKSARVTAPVLVCKIMPDHQRMCPIHRRNLVKKQIRLEQGHYNLVGYLCPDCMDFFLEEKEIYPVAEALERRNIDAWIQPLEMTLQEWKENTFPLEFTEDIIYIPDTWIEGNMACPIHKNVLVEDTYRKTYKDRSVVFQACRCEECNKLLMRNSKAQELEMECGEIGIPPIEFKRLRLVEKKDKLLKIKPDYFVQNGMMSSYDYDEEADWDILTEKDIVVVSYSRTCTNEGHDAEDILGLVTVCEKKAGIKHYLILMGYCSECERYYMDQDDYMLIYKKGRPELTIYNDTDSNFYITSGRTYDTEKEHLDKLEGDFDKRISEIRNTKGFVGKYQTGDYDDGNLSFAKYRSQDLQKEIERISEYVEKPYGYRTDITLGESGKTFYLGPQDIEVNGEKRFGPLTVILEKNL